MKKFLLLLIIVGSLSVGCNKNTEISKNAVKEEQKIVYCSECASESNELSKYCKNCGELAKWVTEKPEIKEEEDTNEDNSQDNQETKKQETNNESKKVESDYSRGYKAGYKEGYYRAQVDDFGGDAVVETEYDRGFADGYNAGWMQCVADGKDLESKQKEEASKNNGKIYGSGDECPRCGESVVYWDKYYYWETEENRYECSKCGITYYEY